MIYILFSLIIVLIIFLPIIKTIYNIYKENKVSNTKAEMTNKIMQYDPNFNLNDFIENAKKSVIELYNSYSIGNLKKLMLLESSNLYSIHRVALQMAIKDNNLNTIVITKINNFQITDFKIEGNKEIINIKASIFAIELNVTPQTKEIKTPGTGFFTTIYIEYIRSINVHTKKGYEFNLNQCPNCGAKIDINSLGKCLYCDSLLINGEHSWVINKISNL